MSHSKSMQIIEKAYKDHARKLVKWALRRFKSHEDAEDFCSEVMTHFSKAVITKEVEGEEIANPDNYLWIVAHNLMNDHQRDTAKKEKLVEAFVGTLLAASEFADIEGTQLTTPDSLDSKPDETEDLLRKLRISISQLDFNLREAMIMYHLEKKSLTEISKKLKVTESYVKKLLFESRQRILQNDKKNLYQVDKVYRPNSVMFCISGECLETYDFQRIDESLTKQNICLACYEKPLSIEEIARALGFPCAYIEFDLKWLVNSGFIKKTKNKYSTTFFILDGTFDTRVTNIFFQHKERCLDKIVSKLATLQPKIKKIGFKGCDKPINELLWLMIYTFTHIACENIYAEVMGSKFVSKDEVTGKPYHLLGIFSTDSTIPLDPLFTEKYMELRKWSVNGPYHIGEAVDRDGRWLWLSKGKEYLPTNHSGNFFVDYQDYKEFLWKVCRADFRLSDLSDEERVTLEKCVDLGLLSVGVVSANNEPTVIPNFYVFSPAQIETFYEILEGCYADVSAQMRDLFMDVRNMCKACLPKQLEGSLDFVTYISMLSSNVLTTGFAYYDGKLAVAEGEDDFTVRTMHMTVGG